MLVRRPPLGVHSIAWGLGFELGLPGLAASTSTHWAISLVLVLHFSISSLAMVFS